MCKKLTKNDLRWIVMILEGDMRTCKSAMAENSSPETNSLESHLLELRIDRCKRVQEKIQSIVDANFKRIEVG